MMDAQLSLVNMRKGIKLFNLVIVLHENYISIKNTFLCQEGSVVREPGDSICFCSVL